MIRPFGQDPLIATVGLTRSIAPSLALDIGIGLGLNDDAPDNVILAGLTMNLGPFR